MRACTRYSTVPAVRICSVVVRDPEMVYPRITRVKVIPGLSPGYQILKVMDNACSAYVLQCTVIVQSTHRAQDEALLLSAAL